MIQTKAHTNKTVLRVILAAAAVLLLTGVLCGVAAADGNYGIAGKSNDYTTLAEAYKAAASGDTIEVLDDVTEDETEMTGDKSVILDLNGHTITAKPDGVFNGLIEWKSHGMLAIWDSKGNGTLNGDNETRVLYVAAGIVVMESGTIIGGSAQNGGGVYVAKDGSFTMSGSASITGNRAGVSGGGVYNKGTFIMYGGKIIGNSAAVNGSGVYLETGTLFSVKGSPIIKNNSVYLEDGMKITISNRLDAGAKIQVTPAGGAAPGTSFTKNWSAAVGISPSSVFTADNGDYAAAIDAGEVKFIEANYKVSDSSSTLVGSTLTLSDAYRLANSGDVITVLKNVTESGTEITGDKSVNLDLNGHTITAEESTFTDGLINWNSSGTLTIKDSKGKGKLDGNYRTRLLHVADGAVEMEGGTITKGSAGIGCGVCVAGGSFTMSGSASITGNIAEGSGIGGGVYVAKGGSFTMSGSASITGNSAEIGGGVYVDDGSFTMNGGSISSNTATVSCGGVFNSGTFTMNGGTISGNSARESGGGMYNIDGTFTMNGGSITGNEASNGGGVYVNGGSFTMNGGSITKNKAANESRSGFGGGVYLQRGTFNLEGGTIGGDGSANTATGNGGGVYVTMSGTFNVKGAPVIKNNAAGDPVGINNVYLKGGATITVDKTVGLTGGEIGVTTEIPPLKSTSVAITGKNSADYSGKFTSDGELYSILNTGTGDNQVVKLGFAYTVAFSENGHGTAPASVRVLGGEKVTEPAAPAAAGYTFGGWYKEAECTNPWNFDKDTVTKDTTLYAKWTEDKPTGTCTVKFDMQNHGTAIPEIKVEAGKKVPRPADPTEKGWTFVGWYKEAACTNAWDFDKDTVTKDTTLYAKWAEDKPETYTVKFDMQGHGTAIPEVKVEVGKKVTKPADPAEKGWTFGGWFKEAACTNVWDFNTPVTADMTLYAKWTEDKPTVIHTVKFNLQGHGTPIADKKVESGKKVTRPADPTTEGYTFGGWFKEAACTNAWNFDTAVTADMTLYAKWTIKTYTVTFDVRGHGTAPAAQTVNHGSKAIRPADPETVGYTFGGWYADKGCAEGTEWDFNTSVTSDITIYAKWTANKYTIFLSQEDADISGTPFIIAEYDSSSYIPVMEKPWKAGCTLDGWISPDGKEVIDGDGTYVPNVSGYTDAEGRWILDDDTDLTAAWRPYEGKFPASESGDAEMKVDLIPHTETQQQAGLHSAHNVKGYVYVNTDPDWADEPEASDGYKLEKTYSVYEMEATPLFGSVVKLNVWIELSDGENPKNVCLRHYTESPAPGFWDSKPIHPVKINEVTEPGSLYTHELIFEISKFSPFALTYETPIKKGGSSSKGTSYWATPEPTETPTPTPTATPTPVETPTVKPVATETPTAKSPAPFMGILAGLGCAAVVFGLRRK